MDFDLPRLTDYSDDALLVELQRVAKLVSNTSLTRKVFDTHARTSSSTIIKRFNGWGLALERAGLESRYGGPKVTARMRSQPGKAVSQADAISELQRVALDLGRDDLTVDDFNDHAVFSVTAVRTHFATWRQALEAAGLRTRRSSLRYTDDECFENLLEVWSYYGRAPQYLEMKSAPSKVGPKAYLSRWGTWTKALKTFVDRVGTDDAPTNEPAPPPTTLSLPKAAVSEVDSPKIRLGLRYRVLNRDLFKCVLCGTSPAVDARCKLHVDHIHPFAKGGRTIFENLRTLCSACNLGKSDLTIESDAP